MWVVLEVLICLSVVLAVCFYAGKRIGERQYLKVREEMKALELAFNQLLEQMEMVSGHNLKIMETKTNELHELLPIIDKKVLYVRDLLDEVEEREKKRPAGSAVIAGLSAEPVPDTRLKREVEDLRSAAESRLQIMESGLQNVESRLQTMESQLSQFAGEFQRIIRQITDSLPASADLEQIPRLQREIDRLGADCRRLIAFQKDFEQLATMSLESSPIETELIEASLPSSVILSPSTATTLPTFTTPATPTPDAPKKAAPMQTSKPTAAPFLKHSFDTPMPEQTHGVSRPSHRPSHESHEASRQLSREAADLALHQGVQEDAHEASRQSISTMREAGEPGDSGARETPAPQPAAGLSAQQQSRSHEILNLLQQGITIPQIARRLCMVPGEVELIINIFGPKATPRRALYR